MALPPRLSQLRVDQIQDASEETTNALTQVFYALNPFIQATKGALTKGLGWENFKAVQKTVEVTTVPLVVLISELTTRPSLVLVTQSLDLTTGKPAICPSLAWEVVNQNGKQALSITEASPYDSSHVYRWNLLVTG